MGSRRHFFCINVNLRVGNTYRILIYHDISWCILGILVLQCAWIILIYHGVSWCILGDDFPRNLQWVRAPLRGLPFRGCDLHRHGMSWYCFSNVFHIADSFGSAGYTWLVVWLPFFIFPYIEFLIIPIDFHIFQRGGPTTNQPLFVSQPLQDFPLSMSQETVAYYTYDLPEVCSAGTVEEDLSSAAVCVPTASCGNSGTDESWRVFSMFLDRKNGANSSTWRFIMIYMGWVEYQKYERKFGFIWFVLEPKWRV